MELIEPVAKDVRQARPHAVGAHPNGLSDHYNNQMPSQAPLFPRLAACPISQATTSLHPACSAMSSGVCPDQGAGQLRSAPKRRGELLGLWSRVGFDPFGDRRHQPQRRFGRVEDGRGSWGPMAITPFPISAHLTGGPDFRSPALRLASLCTEQLHHVLVEPVLNFAETGDRTLAVCGE